MGSGGNNNEDQPVDSSQAPSAGSSQGGGVSVDASGSVEGAGTSQVGASTAGLAGDSGSGGLGAGSSTVKRPRWLGKRVGRFRLLALLGQGAMGRVFRAEDTLMGRHVALKMLPRTLKTKGGGSIGPESLIREARAAAAIEHPNAVTVYEVNQAGDVCYVAMELLEGGSLRDLVRAAGPMDLTRACLLCAEAAEALAAAHAAGVVHRDVKPANLMLSRSGRCKVVDFGLARLDEAGAAAAAAVNGAENVGTPQFIAPEILQGAAASPASDVYSLGGTLFYLLTGRPPFEARSARELLRMHLNAPVPDLKAFRPDAGRGLADAVARALAKRPADRWSGMEQFARVLRVHAIPIAIDAASVGLSPSRAAELNYVPPPMPGYFPPGPVVESSEMTGSRPARPASPIGPVEAAPAPEPPPVEHDTFSPEPEPQVEPVRTHTSRPAQIRPPHHALPAWPLMVGGGVLIAAVVAVLCIVFLKAPPADVAASAAPNTPPRAPQAPAPKVEAAPAAPPAAPEPAAEPVAETLPPSLLAQWVADDYQPGDKWVDRIRQIRATPVERPADAPNAFNGHTGIKLNGASQYFKVSESDDPLTEGTTMTVVAVFRPAGAHPEGKAFWDAGGLVGADMPETTGDWGLGWGGKTGVQAVAGAGNLPPGKDDTRFSPDLDVTRTHVAAMTWTFAGKGKRGNATLRLYVDGFQVDQTTASSEPRRAHLPLALGAADVKGQHPFAGLLAEVRLYDDANVDVAAISRSLLKQYAADNPPPSPIDPNDLFGQ
jgi:serine/threonine-protein kinase